MVKPIKGTLTVTRAVVNPYYGNSLYSEYPPALTTNLNNKHASEKNRDRIGSLHNYYMVQMALHIQYIPFLCSLQKCMTRETDI